MVVPAPGLFSMMIGWPRRGESFSPTARATMSTPPPGGNGAMKRIGFAGYCAAAGLFKKKNSKTAKARIVMAGCYRRGLLGVDCRDLSGRRRNASPTEFHRSAEHFLFQFDHG